MSIVYLDVDGVLLDFNSAAAKTIGCPGAMFRRWNWFEDCGVSADNFWRAITDRGRAFYTEDVQAYPWANQLVRAARRFGEVRLLTVQVAAPDGKLLRLAKEWPDVPVFTVSNSDLKIDLAGPRRILVDDKPCTVQHWARERGTGVLFPRPWNHAPETDDPVYYVKSRLEQL